LKPDRFHPFGQARYRITNDIVRAIAPSSFSSVTTAPAQSSSQVG
jgi:hypothetical protein